MSIGLFVSYRNIQKEDRLIPIASDYIFSKHWKPISAELNLRWVPRFHNGWMLSVQDMPHILAELAQLRRYLTCGETHAEISHHMLARISVLMRELNEVYKNMDADAFVGSPCQAQRRAAAFRRQPLISHSSISDPKAVSAGIRAALGSTAPADRSVDPLPGPVCGADSLPETLPMPWRKKFRALLANVLRPGPATVPPAWRTDLDVPHYGSRGLSPEA